MARKTYGDSPEEFTDKPLETQSSPVKIRTLSASKLLGNIKATIASNLIQIKQNAISTLDNSKKNVSVSLEEQKRKNIEFLTNIK